MFNCAMKVLGEQGTVFFKLGRAASAAHITLRSLLIYTGVVCMHKTEAEFSCVLFARQFCLSDLAFVSILSTSVLSFFFCFVCIHFAELLIILSMSVVHVQCILQRLFIRPLCSYQHFMNPTHLLKLGILHQNAQHRCYYKR